MKKLIVLLILFMAFFISIESFALDKSYRFVWSSTYVEVPLYQDLDDYKYIPEATLYIDGIKKNDAIISINPDGDWLYLLDDVDVSKVGEYKVWYKASESRYKPGTCTGYKALVTFKVVDTIKPQVYPLEDNISFPQGTTITKELLLGYFKGTDNYSKALDFSFNGISFDSSVVGDYNATITVTDEAKNYTTLSFNINIYNKEAPKIKFTGANNHLSIQKDEKIDIRAYFEITDDFDKNIASKAIFPVIDTSVLGEIEYVVSVTDSSDSQTTYTITVEIVDEIIPVIELHQYEKTENYLAADSFDFMSYVKSLTDNNKILDNSLVKYDTNIESKVGLFYVNYYYFDEGGNKATATLAINLVSFKGPKITIDQSKTTIKQGQKLNIDELVTVEDDSDPLVEESLVITGGTDFSEIGTYTLEAYAINSSGVATTKSFYVYVEEDNPILGLFKSDNWVYLAIVAGAIIVSLGSVFYVMKIKRERKAINQGVE